VVVIGDIIDKARAQIASLTWTRDTMVKLRTALQNKIKSEALETGDHRERWAGSALLLAESKFHRLNEIGVCSRRPRNQERTCRKGKDSVTC